MARPESGNSSVLMAPSQHVSFTLPSIPLPGYTPLSASRSAKSTAIKAQPARLLCILLPVAAILPLGRRKNTLVTGRSERRRQNLTPKQRRFKVHTCSIRTQGRAACVHPFSLPMGTKPPTTPGSARDPGEPARTGLGEQSLPTAQAVTAAPLPSDTWAVARDPRPAAQPPAHTGAFPHGSSPPAREARPGLEGTEER